MIKIAFMETPSPWLVRQNAQTSLGLLYLATITDMAGYTTEMFKPKDFNALDRLLDFDIVCMGGTTLEYPMNVDCAHYLKNKNPKITIFIGGSHITAMGIENVPDTLFDAICIGEGEDAILEMIHDYELKQLKKRYISYSFVDINRIPVPNRALIPGSHGGEIFAGNEKRAGDGGNENFITSRGCPFNCSFCASRSIWKGKMRYRSIENISYELQYITAVSTIKQLRICDDNITSNTNRLADLCAEIKNCGFVWRCSVRAESLTKKTCKLLHDGGCREVSVGIESGDQRVLDYLNKRTTIQKMLEGCRNAKEAGITVRALFMIGTPGEQKDTPERNLQFIKNLDYDLITLSTFIPLPGTDIWKYPDKFNCKILTKDFRLYNKDYVIKNNDKIETRTYTPLIQNLFLTKNEMISNVARMEKYVQETGKYNKG